MLKALIEAKRRQLEKERSNVPGVLALEGLLRYEASLDRTFDRTLSQLERAQRIRLGQNLLPEQRVRMTLE